MLFFAALGTIGAAAAQDHNCELSTLFVHLNEIQEGCCGDGACEATGCKLTVLPTSGVDRVRYTDDGWSASRSDPDEDDACDRACGEIFEPFWDNCGEMLNRMRVDGTRGMGVFYDTCLSILYPPGVRAHVGSCTDLQRFCARYYFEQPLCAWCRALCTILDQVNASTSALLR
eukprot:SAG31_NODE_1060_length_10111_cov_17.871354_10_plen_173_part_00